MFVENVLTRVNLDGIEDLSAELSVRSLEDQGFYLKLRILNPPVNKLEEIFRLWHKQQPVSFSAGIPEKRRLDIPHIHLLRKEFEGTDLLLEAAT